jgi:4-aminobutyrate aminotransferase
MSVIDLNQPATPEIITPLPGPKTKALIERDNRVISPSYTRGYPFSIDKGRGAVVYDLDGNRFLDFCAGIAVCSTGHCHPEVVQAIKDQADRFLHMSGTDFYYESMADLAQKLSDTAPGNTPRKVFFTNSGTESNEGALKLARYYTGRDKIVSFYRSFHGRTFGSMSVSASKVVHKKRFSPLLPGVFHTYYPYFYRDPIGRTPEECADNCIRFIKEFIFKMATPPDEVAAFLVEPVQGEGGYVVPPPNFLPALQELAHQHGILVIADEVQSGVGRTGKMWASQHFEGFDPDIITSAKGLASGLPLGAIIAKEHIMTWEPGTHATTFGGNPVACAASLKTLDLLERGLLENAQTQGAYLMQGLKALQQEFDVIGDVRGFGLMIGMELVTSRETREKAGKLRDEIVDACFYEGLLILGCGENTIRFCPPLVITQAQIETALRILRSVMERLTSV